MNPPSFHATKKEPIDGSHTRLALQNTAGAATAAPAAFINTKVFSESSESSVKKISSVLLHYELLMSILKPNVLEQKTESLKKTPCLRIISADFLPKVDSVYIALTAVIQTGRDECAIRL